MNSKDLSAAQSDLDAARTVKEYAFAQLQRTQLAFNRAKELVEALARTTDAMQMVLDVQDAQVGSDIAAQVDAARITLASGPATFVLDANPS